MKSLCGITIKLNTLTDIPYQMTVALKILNNGRMYRMQSVITFFLMDPNDRIIMELQCIVISSKKQQL